MSEYVFKTDRLIKNCYDCEFMQDGFCHILCSSLRTDQLANKSCCPLVELPPHGDLVDGADLRDRAYNMQIRNRISFTEALSLALLDAPTVLEASE